MTNTELTEYYIDRNIDGHPICKGGKPLDKKRILELLNARTPDEIPFEATLVSKSGHYPGAVAAWADGAVTKYTERVADRFDLAAEWERLTHLGYAPQLIYDDDGNFAITDEGFCSVRQNCDEGFTYSAFAKAEWFRPTPKEAWEAFILRMRSEDFDV